MQISFCFCKNCICLKILEDVHISISMIDNYSEKCVFILNAVICIDALWNISIKFFKNVMFYDFNYLVKGLPNEAKGMINLKSFFLFFQGSFYLNEFVCNGWSRNSNFLKGPCDLNCIIGNSAHCELLFLSRAYCPRDLINSALCPAYKSLLLYLIYIQ